MDGEKSLPHTNHVCQINPTATFCRFERTREGLKRTVTESNAGLKKQWLPQGWAQTIYRKLRVVLTFGGIFGKQTFSLGINLLLARFFCCRWLSIEDNQWSVITIIALLWLADCLFPPGEEREMQWWRKSLLLLNWRQKPKWEIGLFLTSSPCIIHKEGDISCGTFGKSLIYLGLPESLLPM